jgi:hypothetical protein
VFYGSSIVFYETSLEFYGVFVAFYRSFVEFYGSLGEWRKKEKMPDTQFPSSLFCPPDSQKIVPGITAP